MWYVFDEHRNLVDKDNLPYIKGETYTFDDIETYCLLGTADADHPLFVDKNHDLSYYLAGSDYVDESDSYSAINATNKYGYEWGGYEVETGVTTTTAGTGLSNTNSLIEMNLQSNWDGWYVVWDKIKEFRQSHSDNWFLPSKDELNLIYEARSNLSGLTTINDFNKNPYYCSSSESDSEFARYQDFSKGNQSGIRKYFHGVRSRLCYTI